MGTNAKKITKPAGGISAAPKFNIISQLNDWSRSVARGKRSIDEGESKTGIMQRAYWVAFQSALNRIGGPVSGNRKPQAQPWMSYPIGRSGFHLNTVMTRTKKQVRAELYIAGDDVRAFLALLRGQKDAIERELGYPLE